MCVVPAAIAMPRLPRRLHVRVDLPSRRSARSFSILSTSDGPTSLPVPAEAEQGLVHVRVRVHEPRKEQPPAAVDDLRARGWRQTSPNRRRSGHP